MLGDPDITSDQHKPVEVIIPCIENSVSTKIKFIYSAYNKCAVVDDKNHITLWGVNFNKFKVREPEVFYHFEKREIKKICFGPKHGLALVGDGKLYAWGDGTYGELGDSEIESSDIPRKIGFFYHKSIKVKTMSCGLRHSVVICDKNRIYTFGDNTDG